MYVTGSIDCQESTAVVTVSPGITRLLAETYSLAEPPLVVLNVPEYCSVETHPVGERLELLYHGLLASGRGTYFNAPPKA